MNETTAIRVVLMTVDKSGAWVWEAKGKELARFTWDELAAAAKTSPAAARLRDLARELAGDAQGDAAQ